MDITVNDETGQPYDFSIKAQRTKAETLLAEQQPMLPIGSPMCTAFSAIQAINNIPGKRDPLIIACEKAAGRLHLDWWCFLYRKQISRGVYFLHEHPNGAASWMEPSVLGVLSLQGVRRIRANQCMHGQANGLYVQLATSARRPPQALLWTTGAPKLLRQGFSKGRDILRHDVDC